MSSPGSAAASVDVTRSQTPADANNIDKDGDDEPVLPEKLSFLLQQSSIYSRIIADKLARDTLERQRRDAKADTRKNNKAKKQAERDNQAGRDTRSGNAAGAVNKTGQQKKPARGRVSAASKQSDSYNGDGNDVKARDFTSDNDGDADADASIQVHSGARVTRQGNNPRTRLNAKEAPAKQVASALGLNGRTAARNAQNKVANGSTKPNGTTRSQNGKAKEEIMDLSSTDDEEEEKPSKSNGKKGKAGDVQDSEDEGDQPRQAKEEDEEGEDDDDDDDDDGNEEAKSRQPSLVKGATMKSYQLAGMEWLISLYENGLNGILADEMGLGKTLQTIAFLSYLREKGVWGPFLVVCPLSTLANWVNEFERFTPDFPALLYHGTPKEREDMREERMRLPVDMHKGKRAEVTRSKRGAYYFNTVETFPVVVTS
ncbi:putative ATPase [Cystobasidiomycetes sp. EMM_F5]